MRKIKLLNNKGMTLTEGLIAMMIVATSVTAIFSVVATSFQSDVNSDTKEDATLLLKKASERVKVYVTADGKESLPTTLKRGVCGMADGVGKQIIDDSPQQTGRAHDISCMLVDSNGNDLYPDYRYDDGWRLTYTITEVQGCRIGTSSSDISGTTLNDARSLVCRQVSFSLAKR